MKICRKSSVKAFQRTNKISYNTILLTYYLRNEYNSLATKAANGKRCNHDKEKASQIKLVRKWLKS